MTDIDEKKQPQTAGKRETEPMPASFRPFWMLLLSLFGVTVFIAGIAAVINWVVLV